MARDGRENVRSTRFSSSVSRGNFAARVHQTAVAYWSQDQREREIVVQHASLQVASTDGHRAAGTEQNIAKYPAVFRQRKLGFGAPIQIIENRLRKPASRQKAQVLDIDNSRGIHSVPEMIMLAWC
jgi:hypothetical protein